MSDSNSVAPESAVPFLPEARREAYYAGESPYHYNPATGIIVGPPRRGVDKLKAAFIFLHEVVHLQASSTALGAFMRLTVEALHEGIFVLIAQYGQEPSSVPTLLVPGYIGYGFMQLRSQFLGALVESSRLVEEVYACLGPITWLRRMADEGDIDYAKSDIDDLEEEVFSAYVLKMPQFTSAYTRLRAVVKKVKGLDAMIQGYALNGPVEDLLDPEVFPRTADTDTLLEISELDRQRELVAAIERMHRGSWDSPDERFLRAIDAATDLPSTAGTMNRQEVYRRMSRSLPDLTQALKRAITNPLELNLPHLGANLVPNGPLTRLSVGLWTRMGGPQVNEYVAGGPESVLRESYQDRLAKNSYPFLFLEKEVGEEKYKIRYYNTDPDELSIAADLLELEFLRSQLHRGRGLTCLYDVLDEIDHPTDAEDTTQGTPHRTVMEALWNTTDLDPDRDRDAFPDCEWTEPSCLAQDLDDGGNQHSQRGSAGRATSRGSWAGDR